MKLHFPSIVCVHSMIALHFLCVSFFFTFWQFGCSISTLFIRDNMKSLFVISQFHLVYRLIISRLLDPEARFNQNGWSLFSFSMFISPHRLPSIPGGKFSGHRLKYFIFFSFFFILFPTMNTHNSLT